MSSKSLQIKGADDTIIEIAPGDYMMDAKERRRRTATAHKLSTEARRVYDYLSLCTMGFAQELAVKQVRDKGKLVDVPISPTDIIAGTKNGKGSEMDLAHVARAMDELNAHGLAERRSDDGGPLRKGHVVIYSWAVPRPAVESRIVAARGNNLADLPAECKPLLKFLKSWKIKPDPGIAPARGNIDDAILAIAQLEKAQMVARAMLKSCFAPSRINKDERNERNERKDQTPPPPQKASNTVEPPPAKAEEEEEATAVLSPPQANPAPAINGTASSYDRFKATYPREQFDESKAKPFFEKLKPDEQLLLFERLPQFLACALWRQQPRYIPFASKFLKENIYAYDPPPLLPVASNGNGEDALGRKDQEFVASMQRANARLKAKQERGEL